MEKQQKRAKNKQKYHQKEAKQQKKQLTSIRTGIVPHVMEHDCCLRGREVGSHEQVERLSAKLGFFA